MKKTLFYLSLTALLIVPNISQAQNYKSIQLTDGSTIQGQIVEMSNGTYTIDTPALGRIQLDESKVAGMMAPGMAPQQPQAAVGGANPYQADILAMQQQIFMNPEVMKEIQAMAEDPEIMQLLSDPSLMQAATSMNVDGISSNQNAQVLMNNPKMQALMEKIQAGQ